MGGYQSPKSLKDTTYASFYYITGDSMKSFIKYQFTLPEGQTELFVINPDDEKWLAEPCETDKTPVWYNLDFKQCPNCTLRKEDHPLCPMMAAVGCAASKFSRIVSFETVDLTVTTEERTIIKKTTAQRALSSFLGLLIALSGCPHTVYFRPMAKFHLPLATEDETVFRAAGMYLLAQYLRKSEGLDAEFNLSGLKTIYENIRIVNMAVARRLREATKADAMVNAVILLDLFARALPDIIDMKLEELRPVFAPYLL